MNLKSKHWLPSIFLMAVSASLHANTYAYGGADDQLDITSIGPDITYFVEIGGFFDASPNGDSYANYTDTTNYTDYFNTNSNSGANGNGSVYEESIYGIEYFLANTGTYTESVTMSWQGFDTATTFASGNYPTSYSYQLAESYLQDGNEGGFAFFNDAVASTYLGTGDQNSSFDEGSYTFYLTPGESDVIASYAYNEGWSVSVATTPGPEALIPFLVGGAGVLGRRIRLKRRLRNC